MYMFLINCETFHLMIILIFLKFMHNFLSASIMNSRYLMISILNLHLLTFNCNSMFFNHWKILQMCFWYFFKLFNKNIKMSFKYADMNSFRKFWNVQLIYFWNVLETFISLKKMTSHSKNSYHVQKAVNYLFFLMICILWKTCIMLNFMNHLVLLIHSRISLIRNKK